MALLMTSRGLLRRAKNALEHGPARSGAIMAVSAGVGMVAGKQGDMKKVPLYAAGTGVALNLIGLHTLGDGALSGGLALLGYNRGAKMGARQTVAAMPTAAPARLPAAAPAGRRRA